MLSQSNDKFRSSANAVSAAALDLNLSIGLSSFAEADIATAYVRLSSYLTVPIASADGANRVWDSRQAGGMRRPFLRRRGYFELC